MSYKAVVNKVMIASPGDVVNERKIFRDVIHEWNAIHADDRKVVLLPVGWESHASPLMGERAQAIINKQILEDADLLVAAFWTRLGSPTGKSPSGTVEEIEEHLNSGKPAMIYFSLEPVRLDSVDEEQYAALKQFKEQMRQRGLVHEYESLANLRETFSRHLAQTVIRYFSDEALPKEDLSSTGGQVIPELSDAAKELLLEAVQDDRGTLLRIRTRNGLGVQTNGRAFVQNTEPREEARWEGAVYELRDLGFLQDQGYKNEVFRVTEPGYEIADRLAESG